MLRVYPNPWAATDKNGVPCGVCPRDPEADAGGPGQYVGARVDRKRTTVLQKLDPMEIRSARQITRYEYMGLASDDPELRARLFELEPVELPASRYYRQRLQDGSLLAADAETAAAAKIKEFVARTEPRSTALDGDGGGLRHPPVPPVLLSSEPLEASPGEPGQPNEIKRRSTRKFDP